MGSGDLTCQNITTTGSITRGPTTSTVSAPIATIIYFEAHGTITQGTAVKLAGGGMKVLPYLSGGTDDNCVGIATSNAVVGGFVGVQVSGLMRANVVTTDTGGVNAPVAGQVCGCVSTGLRSVGTTTADHETEFILCHLGTLGTYDSLVMWIHGSVY